MEKIVLAINDNPFAYTQEKREELIVELFDKGKRILLYMLMN